MRVRFTHDFDYKPTSQATIAYKAGMEMKVKRECGERAIAANRAVAVRPQPRNEEANGQG